jgi:hypothetical protein
LSIRTSDVSVAWDASPAALSFAESTPLAVTADADALSAFAVDAAFTLAESFVCSDPNTFWRELIPSIPVMSYPF